MPELFFVELYRGRQRVAARLAGRPQPWRWRAKSVNGEKLAQSESYVNASDAVRTIRLLFGDNVDIRQLDTPHG